MPLPLFLGIGAAVAGVAGAGAGAHGAVKMKKANDKVKEAKKKYDDALESLESENRKTSEIMDVIGNTELRILKSFEIFTDIFEKIQNKPELKSFSEGRFNLPDYNPEQLKKVGVGAGVLLGGLGGAALGTAGGFAAAGATTAAVMALGTASTGTAIASLSGVAATNATLAALGGGALAAGGGGMALGSAVLGGATLGVGLLVGGIIFNVVGRSIENKAEEAKAQANKTQDTVNSIRKYLMELRAHASKFNNSLQKMDGIYRTHLNTLDYLVNFKGKTNWNDYAEDEKLLVENTVLLVQMLYTLCKTKLVLQAQDKEQLNTINKDEIARVTEQSELFLKDLNLAQ